MMKKVSMLENIFFLMVLALVIYSFPEIAEARQYAGKVDESLGRTVFKKLVGPLSAALFIPIVAGVVAALTGHYQVVKEKLASLIVAGVFLGAGVAIVTFVKTIATN